MLDAELRRPAPQIPAKSEGRSGQRRERGGRQWRDEERILTGDHGGVFPVEPHAGRLQADDSKVNRVAGSGESSGKIELNIGRRPRSGEGRAEDLESDFGLAQRGSDAGLRRGGSKRLRKVGKV